MGGIRWNKEDDRLLEQLWGNLPTREIALRLGRSVKAVQQRAYALGLSLREPRRKWTAEEDEYLRQHYGRTTTPEIAAALGRTQRSVRERARRLGIARRILHKEWTQEELDFLLRHYRARSGLWIADQLQREPASVYSKIKQLGLKLPAQSFRRHSELLDSDPYADLPEITKARIAAYLDSEGHVDKGFRQMTGGDGHPFNGYTGIRIINTYYPLISWLAHSIPGAIIYKRKPRPNRKQQWEVRLNGWLRCYLLLRALIPYLIVKKEVAMKVIQEVESRYPELKSLEEDQSGQPCEGL